ncbi:hypothetical protein JT07_s2gp1 [Cladosporium cladosporioides virus 1]|uniref:Uncharacterized protein n=1 Tax=Cladosporium cladosporioides virus 1 TaxID=1529605 RepID=A0A076JT93_9VIRU|nr:hypothetical protein JT07_s2gp1 [Cladosporium cladosporioides virus 1]AII80568.1 hypothetical protein [Cladosporium cladosporioides virus 1]
MADLARLRHMLLDPTESAVLLASMCHHLIPDPTSVDLFDYSFPPRARDWIISAPFPLFGPAIPASKSSFEAILEPLRAMEYNSLDMAAVLMRSMRVADNPFAKVTRGETTGDVAQSRAGAAQHAAQSPIEFAIYDVLRDAGYTSVSDALSKLQSFLTSTKAFVHPITRQFSRHRSAALFLINKPGARGPTAFLTPFFTSKEATKLFAAVVFRSDILTSLSRLNAARGVTVLGYAARASLEAVRRIVEPAHAIVNEYSFDPQTLSFIDPAGDPTYHITDRTPSVVVAFGRVLSGGSVDACSKASDLRTSLDIPGGLPDVAREYFSSTGNVEDTIRSAATALSDFRSFRDSHPGGHELNKDSGLSFFSRDRATRDRNTAACITRVEEVACLLRSQGRDIARMAFVVEWGGPLNNDSILAALALTGATACVDVGPGAFKVGDSSEELATENDKGAYVCLIPRASTRGLPRMPIVGYESGDSVTQRLDRLLSFISGPDNYPPVAYITGGSTTSGAAPADIIGITQARAALLTDYLASGSFFCGDILIPDVCRHPPDGTDDECLACANFDYSVFTVGDVCQLDGFSLVKPRASYAHNLHLSLEWIHGAAREFSESRTLLALDSVVATNVARNADWGDFVPRDGPRRPHHPSYGLKVKLIIEDVYRSMAEGAEEGIGATKTIVESLA